MANMNTPKVSQMWKDLQAADQIPQRGPLSSCEAELQELMRQIDGMVQTRKHEWEREKQTLLTKLDVTGQELTIQKSTLSQKHHEIGTLRSQLSDAEKRETDIALEYEKQLTGVREEPDPTPIATEAPKVAGMKKEYERLQRRYSKQSKESRRDKERVTAEAQDAVARSDDLHVKLEEYRTKTKEWETHRRSNQKQMESLEAQRRTLAEKCELLQQQNQTYQAQLNRRQDIIDSTEMSLKSQVAQLEGQLDRARDTLNTQDTQLSRMRSSLDEALSGQRRAVTVREKCDDDLRQAQQKARVLEAELERLRGQLDAGQEAQVRGEHQHLSLNQEVDQLRQDLAERDKALQRLHSDQDESASEYVESLQEDLKQAKTELKRSRKAETNMAEQLKRQKTQENERCNQLSAEIDELRQEQLAKDKTGRHIGRSEIHRLKSELAVEKQARAADMEGMKREMVAMTTELHQRNSAVATLSEKLVSMEREMRDLSDQMDKKQAELQVCNAQLEALRLENRHLRRAALGAATSATGGATGGAVSPADSDVAQAEKHLLELQQAYTSSITTMETQNTRLTSDVNQLREQLKVVQDTVDERIQDSLRDAQQRMEAERRQLLEARDNAQEKVKDLDKKMASTVTFYESQMEAMKHDMTQLEADLSVQNQSMQRLGVEHEMMVHFVEGVDTLVQSGPAGGATTRSDGPSSSDNSWSRLEDVEDAEDFMGDSAELATARFLQQQEARTKDLERRLDTHIANLRQATEATVLQCNGT